MKTFIDLATLRHNISQFSQQFNGSVYYAVKANPSDDIIRTFSQENITGFDVASLDEMERVQTICPNADMIYTHPIKKERDIAIAYQHYGLRSFVIDSLNELNKIERQCDLTECCIVVRVKIPLFAKIALQNLDAKFGASLETAKTLVLEAHSRGAKLGLCFHVGSQQESENAHIKAVEYLSTHFTDLGLEFDYLSIGGGFPASYEFGKPTQFEGVVPDARIIRANFPIFQNAKIIAEPGRCLVADAASSEVEIIAVDGDRIFIDDGVYGGLMDCGMASMRFPISNKSCPLALNVQPFTIFGPTCDSLDVLPGEYYLPSDTKEGDILTIHHTGAYGDALCDNFNGLVPRPSIYVINNRVDFAEELRSA